MTKNDGGPAFPGKAALMSVLRERGVYDASINEIAHAITTRYPEVGDETSMKSGSGMTLRDWFAGQALADIASTCEAWNITQDAADQLTGEEIAKVASGRSYIYADAMLAEREKNDAEG